MVGMGIHINSDKCRRAHLITQNSSKLDNFERLIPSKLNENSSKLDKFGRLVPSKLSENSSLVY